MQKVLFKFILLTTLYFGFAFQSFSQDYQKLNTADSLFEARRYTQSLELYRELLDEKESSPSMLLKMAFITEGLERTDEALLYLNLYYLKTADETALTKMEELSLAADLTGYVASDTDFFLTIYYRFFNQIVYFLSAVTLFLLLIIVYQKIKYKTKPFITGIAFSGALALLFYLVNFGHTTDYGIVDDSNSPLMSGPSSGSKVIAIINSGHKLKILEQEDVWYKVFYDGDYAYIKAHHLEKLDSYL